MWLPADAAVVTEAYYKVEEDLDSLKSTPQGETFSKETSAHIQDIFAQLDVLKDKLKVKSLDAPWTVETLRSRVANIQHDGKGIDDDKMETLTHDIQQFFLRNFKMPDSPLVKAIKSGDRELTQSLIDKKHYIGGESFSLLYSTLTHVYDNGDIEMLKLLIKNNVDINIVVKHSGFFYDVVSWKEENVKKIMQLLIDNKADFTQNNSDFITNLMITANRSAQDPKRSNAITVLKMLFINNCINLEVLQKREGLINVLETHPEILRLFTYFGMNPPEQFFESKDGKEIYENAKKVRDEAIVEVLRKSDALPDAFKRDPFQIMLGLEGRSMQDLTPELREKALQICIDHDAKAKG